MPQGLGPSQYDFLTPKSGKSRFSFGEGEPDSETLAAIQRREEILQNVGNFKEEPWKATKEFFHLWPFNAVTEPSQFNLFNKGVEMEVGPQVLQDQFNKYFRGRK